MPFAQMKSIFLLDVFEEGWQGTHKNIYLLDDVPGSTLQRTSGTSADWRSTGNGTIELTFKFIANMY